jgi:colanic acid biosynthesis glycosyl transferase WcaI
MRAGRGKIIFVNRFFHPDLSATSQLLSDLAFDLAADRDVVVITSALRYDEPEARLSARENVRGVRVRRVATTGFGRAGLIGKSIDLASFHLMAGIALLLAASRGDVIVAKTDPPLLSVVAAFAARFKGARLINWLQDVYPEVAQVLGMRAAGGFSGRTLQALRNASLNGASANVALGETMAARLEAAGAPPASIRIAPNWTDETAITPLAPEQNPLTRAWGLESKFVVAYSGNLGRAHEYDTMLGAAGLLADDPAIRFLVIGNGHHAKALRTAAAAAGLTNIDFQPYQPSEVLSQSLSVGDVHWISLRPELEGLIVPSKVYGVLAAGRPVIAVTATDGETARLIAAHGCGLQVEPGDSQGFAEAVRRLAHEPGLAARMGAASRAAATGVFSRASALARWREIIDGALEPTLSAPSGPSSAAPPTSP